MSLLWPASYCSRARLLGLLQSILGNVTVCFCVITRLVSASEISVSLAIAMALIEIDIEKKVNSCSCESCKRFGSVAPDGWSNSDSNSDFENDPGAANKKRLSLCRDSKRFKLAKPKEIDKLKQPNPLLNVKRNTNWAVKNLHTWLGMAQQCCRK